MRWARCHGDAAQFKAIGEPNGNESKEAQNKSSQGIEIKVEATKHPPRRGEHRRAQIETNRSKSDAIAGSRRRPKSWACDVRIHGAGDLGELLDEGKRWSEARSELAHYYATAGMEERIAHAKSKGAKELIKPWLQGLEARRVAVAVPSPKKAPAKRGKRKK